MQGNRKNTGADSTKRLTACAMLSALSVVLLYLGSMIQVIDVSMSVIASLMCVFAVIEYGKSAPWLVFGVTSVLSLDIIPCVLQDTKPIVKTRHTANKTIIFFICLSFHIVFYICCLLLFEFRNNFASYSLIFIIAQVFYFVYN